MTAAPTQPLELLRHPLSGHSHRVELFLRILGLPFVAADVDLVARAHKAPEYLALNAFGQVPVLRDGDRTIADSNAILVYLALAYAPTTWLPREPVGASQVQRWLSVAAGQLASGPAAARRIAVFTGQTPSDALIAQSHALLAVIEGHLASTPYLAAAHPTIADLAIYTYVAHAPEGSVSLADYPQVRAWLGRIEALPGFVPMATTKVGLRT